MQTKRINIKKILTIFLFFHLVIWTVVPAISNINLPLDTIEALAWGSNLNWGFDKHPPMVAFFVVGGVTPFRGGGLFGSTKYGSAISFD